MKITAANNPFRSELVTTLPFLPQNTTWEALWAGLEAQRMKGAIVGPCGSGKTTLLEAVGDELNERGFRVTSISFNSTWRRPPDGFWKLRWSSDDALLLDGAEQLSALAWQQLQRRTRNIGAFVLTSHRGGRLPLWLLTSTSTALLARLVENLGVEISPLQIEAIYAAHSGNLRLCLMELYDYANAEMAPSMKMKASPP